MQKRSPGGCATVPVPNHMTIHIGTLQAIIRQSGVSKEKFMRWTPRLRIRFDLTDERRRLIPLVPSSAPESPPRTNPGR